MNLIWARNRFELITYNADQSKLASNSGFERDPRRLSWYTRSAEIASRFEQYGDLECRDRIRKHRSTLLFSTATGSNNFNIPKPFNLDYLPFQTVGIMYAANRVNSLIADDPGLGKTVQAAGFINLHTDIRSIIICLPNILKINWARELTKWLTRDFSIGIVTPDYFPQSDIILINYDILDRFRREVDKRVYDLLICDEAHMLQDAAAKRSRAVFGFSFRGHLQKTPIQARYRLFLTGTPVVNRPENMWTLIQACNPHDLGSDWNFYAKRYCRAWDAPWGYDTSGASNLDELQNRLRGSFMIRRKKSDVLSELPPKRRRIIPLESSKVQKLILQDRKIYDSISLEIDNSIECVEEELKKLPQESDTQSYMAAANKLSLPRIFPALNELSSVRHALAVAKIPYDIAYIKHILEEREKVVIAAHHEDVLLALYKAFKEQQNAALIYGGIESDARQKEIDRFQEDKSCRIIITGITLCVGFHLTAASYGIAVELDWRPSIVTQWEDRMHRIGQKDEVFIDHLVFDNSSDAVMVNKLITKQEVLDKMVG